jgi:hypothetical protein
MLLNPEPLASSSQFDISNQSEEPSGLVKLMDGEGSNISIQSHNSSILQPKLNTQIINVNEGSRLSINEKKELEELREKYKSLNEENTKLKKQLFITRKFIKYFLIKYKDDILLKNEQNQNSININDSDSINFSFNHSQSNIELNKSLSTIQNHSDSNQLNFNTLLRPNSQTIINSNDKFSKSEKMKKFVNSLINNKMKNQKGTSKISKDIQDNIIKEEIRKKKEDKMASPFIIRKIRQKFNIPKNITDTEIKIEIINKNFQYEEAAKFLLEKVSKLKK